MSVRDAICAATLEESVISTRGEESCKQGHVVLHDGAAAHGEHACHGSGGSGGRSLTTHSHALHTRALQSSLVPRRCRFLSQQRRRRRRHASRARQARKNERRLRHKCDAIIVELDKTNIQSTRSNRCKRTHGRCCCRLARSGSESFASSRSSRSSSSSSWSCSRSHTHTHQMAPQHTRVESQRFNQLRGCEWPVATILCGPRTFRFCFWTASTTMCLHVVCFHTQNESSTYLCGNHCAPPLVIDRTNEREDASWVHARSPQEAHRHVDLRASEHSPNRRPTSTLLSSPSSFAHTAGSPHHFFTSTQASTNKHVPQPHDYCFQVLHRRCH